MAGVPYVFANASTSIPLSQLDANFNTVATLGNASVGLGNTTATVGNLTLANVTIVGGSVNATVTGNLFTLGNTVIVGNTTTTSVGNLTVANVTVTNYTESYGNATGNVTISLSNGSFYNVTTNSTTTITLPNSVQGKSFTVLVNYAGNNTIVWAGGTTLKWAGNTTPTPTATTGKIDIFNFYQDGTNTYGAIYGQSF